MMEMNRQQDLFPLSLISILQFLQNPHRLLIKVYQSNRQTRIEFQQINWTKATESSESAFQFPNDFLYGK